MLFFQKEWGPDLLITSKGGGSIFAHHSKSDLTVVGWMSKIGPPTFGCDEQI